MIEELLKWMLARSDGDIEGLLGEFALDASLGPEEIHALVLRLESIGVEV